MTLHKHETQGAFSEHEGETQGALSELEEETKEALSEHEREQQHKEGEAGPASGSANLERPALPALRKLTIDGNIPPILSSRTRSRRPHTGVEGEALHSFLPVIEVEEETGVEVEALHCFLPSIEIEEGNGVGPDGYAGDAGYTGTEKSAAGDGIAGIGRMANGRGDRHAWRNGRELRL